VKEELIAYGERSRYVTSRRVPVAERMSPDMFGLTFHVTTPLQDQFGIITPSSLFYVATHRGSYVPELDPSEHRLMIHGMVDRPNGVIHEDDVIDVHSLPKVAMPNRDGLAMPAEEWKHGSPRLQGYPKPPQ
jgi:sulfane dehydrogenase subunit SoxC